MNDWADAETKVDRAYELYEQGRWAEAAAELQMAIDINPYNASWHFNLGLTLEAMQEYEQAGEAFLAALQLDADDIETLNCLGVNMTRQGKCDQALEHFARIEHLDPTYEPAYCNRIITYTEMGDHEKAELMFYLARQVKDECSLCSYNIGTSLYARGQYDRAVRCWKEVLRLDPMHSQANVRIAEAYWATGRLDQARKYYQAELRLDPGDVDTLLDLGELLGDCGAHEAAAEKFHRVLEMEADNVEAQVCLGTLAVKQGDLAKGERRFRKALRLDPNYIGAHARLAKVYLARRQIRKAAKHLLIELKRCGDDPVMLGELGRLLLEAHMVRQANAALQRLVSLSPDDAYAQHNLGVSFFKLRRMEEGIRHCRRAIKLKPEYPLALYNLALAHFQKGSVARARWYVSRARSIAPGNKQIRRLAKRLGMEGFWSKLRRRLGLLRRRWIHD